MNVMNKKRWLSVIAVCLLLILPTNAFAHTKLESSSPENGQTVTVEVKEVSMVFNTIIEPLSKFEIKDQQGTTYALTDIRTEKSTMTGTLEQPLHDGSYTIEWKIIGLDGHPITGAFGFEVEIPVTEPIEPTATISESSEPTPSASPTEDEPEVPIPTELESEQPVQPEKAEEVSTDKSTMGAQAKASWILLILTGAFIVLALVSLLKKRGGNR